jgi:hypothetical protein
MPSQSATYDARAMLDAIDAAQAAMSNFFDRMRALVQPQPAMFDPNDARYKLPNRTLTDEGAELVYELFDSGKTRFAVKKTMDISFGAADYRFKLWQRMGGQNRPKP